MPRKSKDRLDQTRILIAQEAARIIVQQGVRDYLLAKQKAAERMGLDDRAALPRNSEVEQAVIEYQRLFAADDHDERLGQLRTSAKHAMELVGQFEPRLVGSVLTGSISDNSPVEIHVFADAVEYVVVHLMDHQIPYETSEWHGKYAGGERQAWPKLRFYAETIEINLIVFPTNGLRQAPVSPVDGRPMRRVNLVEVEGLS